MRLYDVQNKEAKQAVAYFKQNAAQNPENGNCYDSLREGYIALGEKDKAIESFKIYLSLNSTPLLKANSLKNLEKLGVK